jgi:CubicO group peptidase (beta-lactamase class C family)
MNTRKNSPEHLIIPFLCFASLLLCTAFAQNSGDKVDAYVEQAMSAHQIPGMSIAVVKNGRIVKRAGYGLASVEFSIPADENSVYQLYSVSKVFAGTAIMKLVEEGKLSLDTPVTDIFDSLPASLKTVRVRHLLTHTSGLPETSENQRFTDLPEEQRAKLSAAESIQLVSELPLKFQPGEKFSYHRSGYVLAEMIIEKLSQKPYASYLQDSIFSHTRMASSRFGDSEAVIPRRPSTAYNRGTGELRNWIYRFGTKDYAAAGLNSSVIDIARFFIALDAGEVLKQESLDAMWAPMRLTNGSESNYGLGWTVDKHKGHRVVGHEGGGSAWIAHFPDDHLTVVVLCNLNGARADEIQYGIADFYLRRTASQRSNSH